MSKFVTASLASLLLAGVAAGAAEPAARSTEAARESKADWMAECVANARKRDASVSEEAARATCRNTTGSGSATRATIPGHSDTPANGSKAEPAESAPRTPARK